MSNLAQGASVPAVFTRLSIADVPVRQDAEGRYCLNDLHKAAGGEQRHRPKYWLENQQTVELIAELEKGGIPPFRGTTSPLQFIEGLFKTAGNPVVSMEGRNGGTFVVKELVYAYAMWISPAFHIKVIRAYDAMVTNQSGNTKPTTPTLREQLAISTKVLAAAKLLDKTRDPVTRSLLLDRVEKIYAAAGETMPVLPSAPPPRTSVGTGNTWEQRVEAWLNSFDDVTTAEVLAGCFGNHAPSRGERMRVGRILTHLGWHMRHVRNGSLVQRRYFREEV